MSMPRLTLYTLVTCSALGVPATLLAAGRCAEAESQRDFICNDDRSDPMCLAAVMLTSKVCDGEADMAASGEDYTAYDEDGMGQTRAMVERSEDLYRRSVDEREARAARASAASAASSSSATNEYPAFDCVLIELPTATSSQKLHNRCSFDIEMHWIDTGGHGNSWSVRADGVYVGGSTAERALACKTNDFLNWRTGMCKD